MKAILKNLIVGAAIGSTTLVLPVGPLSYRALAQTTSSSMATPMQEGTIKALQEALNKQGVQVKTDGVMDDETRRAIRTYQSQHHLPVTGEPDKATLEKLGVAANAGSTTTTPEAPGQATAGGGMMGMMGGHGGMRGVMGGAQGDMSGMMGMMNPEMMQRMMQMQQGEAGQSQSMICPMMQMMAGMRQDAGAHTTMGGPNMLYGIPRSQQSEMTPERVRTWLEQHLARLDNPRLKIGEITPDTDGTVLAEIVTVDGSLVQKLAFNRYPGLVRQVQ